MMPKLSRHLAVASVALAFAACKAEEKPDAFVRATLEAAGGQPRALWEALPPSYQKDARDVVSAFAAKVPAEAYDDSFVLAGKVAKILETKKDFVLGHPALKGAPIKPEDVTKGWDPAVRIVTTLVNSDIKTAAGLKTLDIGKFMGGPMASVVKDFLALADAAGSSLPGGGGSKLVKLKSQLAAVKITVEKVEGDKATVKLVVPDEPEELVEMVKVEGKWLPKDLVDAWPGAIAGAKAAIAGITIEPAMLAQFAMMKGMITPLLDGLLAAKTQGEFDAQIDGAMKAVMGRGGREAPVAGVDDMPNALDAEDDAAAAPVAKPVSAQVKKKKKKASRSQD